MANNDTSTIDDDDDRSDWIEICNPDATSVDLQGWFLTDDPNNLSKWTFPEVTIFSNGYLVVFASEKDRSELGAPLHTNFRLRSDGDYLALANPQGHVVSEFGPSYPPQQPDISFGSGRDAAVELRLLGLNAPAKALIPENGSLGIGWTEVDFDDRPWTSGRTGIGYNYSGLIQLDVGEMRDVNPTVYARIPFELQEVPELDSLILRLQFEDGCIVYLNGEEITRENAPSNADWNSSALEDRPDSTAVSPIDIDISSAINLLRVGENVLAFHGLNRAADSSDLLIRPELIGRVNPNGPEVVGYMLAPTPGLPNGAAVPGVVGPVGFSVASQTFIESLVVELGKPSNASATAEVYYTDDGSIPNQSSLLYAGPIVLNQTTQIRAKMIDPGVAEGVVRSETFVRLQGTVSNFSSNLPLVLLENFDGGRPPQSSKQHAFMAIFEPENGRSSLTATPALTTRAGIKVRGSSTSGRPKFSMSVEAWNEADTNKNISLLGMPAESDWVLWGPYNFDRTLMHNPFIYELSNQIGRYAVRTRFVEVYLNMGGGAVSSGDYFGVYALMEKISRDEDRVDVERLFPEHDLDPGVSGGYLFKIDRADPGDSGFSGPGQTVRYVYPKEVDIERPERDPQEKYVRGYFRDFGRALNGENFRDPVQGYAKFIDVGAAIDHHLLNVLAFNVDALRLSTYFHKNREGKIVFGPIWDFDRALGSTDGRDSNPRVWRASGGDRGTDFFNYPWWGRMFEDIDFFQRYIDRFQSLRREQFSLENINAIIDSMADEVREAQVRDLAKWGQNSRSVYGGTYQGEVNHMKDWLEDRIEFMESQFVAPPELSHLGGKIERGFTLTMELPDEGTIYYTKDGSDPRVSRGFVAEGALRYQGPVIIEESSTVTARVHNPNHTSRTGANNPPLSSKWSGPVTATFSVNPAPEAGDLSITEINYNPAAPTPDELAIDPSFGNDDFEFIELKNLTDETLDLYELNFDTGIQFSFSTADEFTLAPGALMLLAKNRAALEARYGFQAEVVGEYSGNLSNAGELIRLVDDTGIVILEFSYEDSWFPLADGLGFSMVAVQEGAAPQNASDPISWRLSSGLRGSPGAADADPQIILPVWVNEALTHTDLPAVDSVELFNPNVNAVSIGGWFLSDDLKVPPKFVIPDGTMVEAGQFLVLDESDFNSDLGLENSFSLSSLGEEVYLFSADAQGVLTGYIHGFEFGGAENGVTFGRHVTSTLEEHFVIQLSESLGAPNGGVKVGPVVFSEIMYHPPSLNPIDNNTLHEFIELRNLTAEPMPFYDVDHPLNTWKVRGGVDFDFPPEFTLAPEGALLIVSFDPVSDGDSLGAFREFYGLDESTSILGPYSGILENRGERVSVLKPDAPQLPPSPNAGEVPYILVDEVVYSDAAPWPTDVHGNGNSLQRLRLWEYGNDPINWFAAQPSPGIAESAVALSISSITLSGSDVALSFEAEPGTQYAVQVKNDIMQDEWVTVAELVPTDPSAQVELTDQVGITSSMRFYRIIVP